jgi:hypothetical protein
MATGCDLVKGLVDEVTEVTSVWPFSESEGEYSLPSPRWQWATSGRMPVSFRVWPW